MSDLLPEEQASKPSGLVFLVALVSTCVLIAVSAYWRASGEDFCRGLQQDELITLRNYTWAGVNPDGTRRELRRLADIQALGAPAKTEVILGLYCSLGRWPEPNNHIIHSLLLNATLPLFARKEIAIRLPALLAAAGFAVAVMLLCWQCGWDTIAIPAALVSFWHPYVIQYSQEARGYTLMLLLVVLFLIGSRAVMRNPSSILLGACLVLLAVAIFQNTVNMAVDWVLPCYALLILFPGLFDAEDSAEKRSLQRRNLVIQLLCVGLAGFIFLMDRLPAVSSSSRQYGLPFDTPGEFGERLLEDLHYLFPVPPLVIFALLGVAGIVLGWFERPGRGFVALGGFAVVVTVLHFAASRRFAYPRNLGYWLVPVFLGYACLGQRIITVSRRWWQRVVVGAIVWGGTLALLIPGVQAATVTDPAYEVFRSRLQELPAEGGSAQLALLGKGIPDPIRLDFPATWSALGIPAKPGTPVDLLLVEKHRPLPLPPWPGAEEVIGDRPFSVRRLRCRVAEVESAQGREGILIWYPGFESVAVSSGPVLQLLEDREIVFHAIDLRYQAKLDVLGRLACVVAGGQTAAEVQRISKAFAEGQRRFGGAMVFLVPRGREGK
jgi:hypothetical protein